MDINNPKLLMCPSCGSTESQDYPRCFHCAKCWFVQCEWDSLNEMGRVTDAMLEQLAQPKNVGTDV